MEDIPQGAKVIRDGRTGRLRARTVDLGCLATKVMRKAADGKEWWAADVDYGGVYCSSYGYPAYTEIGLAVAWRLKSGKVHCALYGGEMNAHAATDGGAASTLMPCARPLFDERYGAKKRRQAAREMVRQAKADYYRLGAEIVVWSDGPSSERKVLRRYGAMLIRHAPVVRLLLNPAKDRALLALAWNEGEVCGAYVRKVRASTLGAMASQRATAERLLHGAGEYFDRRINAQRRQAAMKAALAAAKRLVHAKISVTANKQAHARHDVSLQTRLVRFACKRQGIKPPAARKIESGEFGKVGPWIGRMSRGLVQQWGLVAYVPYGDYRDLEEWESRRYRDEGQRLMIHAALHHPRGHVLRVVAVPELTKKLGV